MATYQEIYNALQAALSAGFRQQIALVGATESAYELLEVNEDLTDEQILGLRVLLAQAETQLGRYFGM